MERKKNVRLDTFQADAMYRNFKGRARNG